MPEPKLLSVPEGTRLVGNRNLQDSVPSPSQSSYQLGVDTKPVFCQVERRHYLTPQGLVPGRNIRPVGPVQSIGQSGHEPIADPVQQAT
jgi:hypothetical protein